MVYSWVERKFYKRPRTSVQNTNYFQNIFSSRDSIFSRDFHHSMTSDLSCVKALPTIILPFFDMIYPKKRA